MNLATPLDELRLRVEAETGMDLAGERAGRLRDAVEKVQAQRGPGGSWLDRLTAELTVGETYFFRNEHHFRALREHVVPAILRDAAGRREVRVWSAGCATGEEPYSVAILLEQLMPAAGWHVVLLGTDLNTTFLARAREGLYRPWSFRLTDVQHDARYFRPEGDGFRLDARIRGRARFAFLNLVKDVYPSPFTGTLGLDFILFRNVAIYLKPEVTAAIVERFRRALRPGGWLLVSEAELNLVPTDGFEMRRFDRATIFQKKADRAEVAAPLPPILVPAAPEWGPLPTRKAAPGPDQPAWERVKMALARGDYAEADAAVNRAAAKERAALRLRLAQALLACAEPARAQLSLQARLAEDALLLEARLLQASFAEEAGDLAAAERAYRQALYLDRRCPMAHFHLALVQQQRGDRAGAAKSLATARTLIEGRPPLAPVEYGEGICYGRLKEMVNLLLSERPMGDAEHLWERLNAAVARLAVRRVDPAAAAAKLAARAALLRGRSRVEAETPLAVLAFNKGGVRFGVPVDQVLEVQALDSFSPVPRTPPFLPGVIHWRGAILPLLDVGRLIGLPESGISDVHGAVIIEAAGRRVAVVALEIEDLIGVAASRLRPVPEGAAAPREWLAGLADDNRMILKMDVLLADARLTDWRQDP